MEFLNESLRACLRLYRRRRCQGVQTCSVVWSWLCVADVPERCWSQIGYRRKQFGVPLLSFSCRLVVTDDIA